VILSGVSNHQCELEILSAHASINTYCVDSSRFDEYEELVRSGELGPLIMPLNALAHDLLIPTLYLLGRHNRGGKEYKEFVA